MEFNETRYGYVQNLQGDICQIIDANGAVVVEYTYDAWGKVLNVTGSMAGTLGKIQPFRYRGYVYDVETERYYLKSRYYYSNIGRFINADRRILTNIYRYCVNSPVLLTDPTGMSVPEEEKESSFFEIPECYSNDVTVNEAPDITNANSYVVTMHKNAVLYDASENVIGSVKAGATLIVTKTPKGSGFSTYYGPKFGYVHEDDFTIVRAAENWEVEYGVTEWRLSDYETEYVKRIQLDIGVTPDGVYGRETENRIMEIQRSNGLLPDGVVGEKTKKVLYKKYHEQQ